MGRGEARERAELLPQAEAKRSGLCLDDVRSLVPRTPPEGLREWMLEIFRDDLDRCGLVYEAEWVRGWDLTELLDEWAEPRKRKMVRVTCSCCGESALLNWAKSEKCGYGFIQPDDQEGDWGWTVTEAGDEIACPICGARVLVNKRSAVRDYYVTAETSVVSADVVGEGRYLALTCWTVQRRAHKTGHDSLALLPAEAYVFSEHGCAQLMGWANGYSGSAGYFVQYTHDWRQPKRWSECWGQTEHIFGLTPELIDRSCLPHCKLDVYMAPRPGARHYPVPYLRLYQVHPNVEAVLLHGLPRVLDSLIEREVSRTEWKKNVQAQLDLPALDWYETRPAQMLRLTREELRMAREQSWDALFWELFVEAKDHGELLTATDIENAFRLGDEHLALLVPYRLVAKGTRYLLRQCELLATEVDAEGADPIPDAQLLTDYWTMSAALGRDLDDPAVRWPQDIIAAHDLASDLMKLREESDAASQFRLRRRQLRRLSFAADGLLIRPAASQRELTAEGDFLHHCVGTYGRRHAAGLTAIFFIRRAGRPREPYYTLELDERQLTVRQNRGRNNCDRTPEVQAFEDKWLAWVRAGAPRDQNGKPVQPDKRSRPGQAA